MNITNKKGFTLLELLIVITIISVLSVILIVALNPAETLRKARDTQRLSDLASLKTALGIYTTTKTSPLLDDTPGNTFCVGGSAADSIWTSAITMADTTLNGLAAVHPTSFALGSAVDGSGWIPVNLASITGGSPISNMPIDPVNDVVQGTSTSDAVTNGALMYRYACDTASVTFEINAKLESVAFVTEDPKATKDGGNNSNLYEIGTLLTILSGVDDF